MIVLLTLMFCFFGVTVAATHRRTALLIHLVLCNDYSFSKLPPADVPGLDDLQLCTEVRTWVILKVNQEEHFNTWSRLPQGVKVSVQGPTY